MLFKEYNDNLSAAVRAGGNFRSAIFDEVPNITDKPDRNQLMDFLTKLTAAINLETGRYGGVKNVAQVGARSTAIGHIFDFVDNGGGGVFTNVDKYAFAFQLALRVRSPATINQDKTTLCGPVAMVYDIAKRDPARYAQFAISLFTTGTGQLGPSHITPSMTIRSGYQQNLMPEVDYVVLASIRDSDAIVLSLEPIRNILTLTKPGALCEFMSRAGFSNIADHSFLTLSVPLRALNAVTPFGLHGTNHNSYDQGLQNLLNMQNQRNTFNRFIVMNADVEVAGAFVSGQSFRLAPRPDPLPAAETHWTAVRKVRIAGDNVRMKIVTWGGTYEGTIKKAALLSRYAGFVSADP